MKNLTILTLCLLSIPSSYGAACDAIENGKKSTCNNYRVLKNKNTDKLKKLCSMGDINSAYLKIKGVFLEGKCDPKGAIAKCVVRGVDTTFYYDGEMADLKKGCSMMKNTEFVKLN